MDRGFWLVATALLVFSLLPSGTTQAQVAIEDRLVIITPVARTVADPAAAAFAEHARRQFNVTVNVTIV